MRGGPALALALLAMTGPALADPAPQAAPLRVLSMNLCTDQLAMLVAAPGQLVSVSHMARDPLVSAMVAEAGALPVNHGQAEDILRYRPDLVLASVYSAPVTLDMLRRLGIPVAVFPPENDMEGIRDNLRLMGEVLGREAEAGAIIDRFDADLAALAAVPPSGRRAALYAANGYTLGRGSLADAILSAAGLSNVAAELGLAQGGVLPLERLVMARPDLIVTSQPYPGGSRAEEILSHPALRALTAEAGAEAVSDSDWVCGTPHVLRAVARLAGGAS
ncbi:ABC transporter substrate-binding protein [Paracoccus sp. NSM]|uniref:ABC transporter substrate-binding protein n=1 Tax=Paracoccus sp. NSM TaxID=3457784 RepID=UPI004035B7E7